MLATLPFAILKNIDQSILTTHPSTELYGSAAPPHCPSVLLQSLYVLSLSSTPWIHHSCHSWLADATDFGGDRSVFRKLRRNHWSVWLRITCIVFSDLESIYLPVFVAIGGIKMCKGS